MPTLRPCRPDDLPALYEIALLTGDAGADATDLYTDGRLVGEVFAAPYARLCPDMCLVAEDAEGVGAYIVGAADTRAFEAAAERDWWPALRPRYVEPALPHEGWSADQRLSWAIHHPARAPSALVDAYPAHLHVNLLPRLQGAGLGRRMMEAWMALATAAGAKGAHLGVSTANHRALGFYRRLGLIAPDLPRPPPPGVIWMAAALPFGG